MRAAAVALLLALAVVVSDSALARKGGGHVGGGKVHGGHVRHGHGHVNGHHHGHHHKSFGHHHHGHHHHGAAFVGFGVGFAYPWSWYYPPPYYYPGYYYPYPAQPVTYVEQGAAPAAAGWWYYCEASRTYYPYVKECPSGWQRVPALPPPPN
jgi:hypothetical protein